MRPHGSPEALEERRRKASMLFRLKLSLHEVARRIGCHASSVMRWRKAWRRGGLKALTAKPASGRPCKLTTRQKARLIPLLAQGAMSHGYCTELWTTLRIAEVIERRFGVGYHRNHVGKLLHQLHWSPQKPEGRAMERDEKAIEAWKRDVWPAVKKTRRDSRPTSCLSMNPASS
ncbi:MAG: IS630 family transposase [Planctomycetota bacterium]